MILAFIKEIEKAVSDSTIVLSSTIQKHFSSSRKEAYLTGNLLFIDMSSLEFALYIAERGKKTVLDKYRLQYMNAQNRIVFRYDNAPHYRDIPSFPDHKHLRDGKVVSAAPPKFSDVLEEITAIIAQ